MALIASLRTISARWTESAAVSAIYYAIYLLADPALDILAATAAVKILLAV